MKSIISRLVDKIFGRHRTELVGCYIDGRRYRLRPDGLWGSWACWDTKVDGWCDSGSNYGYLTIFLPSGEWMYPFIICTDEEHYDTIFKVFEEMSYGILVAGHAGERKVVNNVSYFKRDDGLWETTEWHDVCMYDIICDKSVWKNIMLQFREDGCEMSAVCE